MNTYAFITSNSFRIEVKASTALAGFNKINSVTHLKDKLTREYWKYDKDGFAVNENVRYLKEKGEELDQMKLDIVLNSKSSPESEDRLPLKEELLNRGEEL